MLAAPGGAVRWFRALLLLLGVGRSSGRLTRPGRGGVWAARELYELVLTSDPGTPSKEGCGSDC